MMDATSPIAAMEDQTIVAVERQSAPHQEDVARRH